MSLQSREVEKSGSVRALKKKKTYIMPCTYHFYADPPVMVRGKGAFLEDDRGKRYLDGYSGVGVVNCGHLNPSVTRAAAKQLQRLHHTTTIYLTHPMLDLAETLAKFIGHGLKRSFFCSSGSEANEGAMLLSRIYTARKDFIALSGSLHGRTELTAAATGMKFWRTDPFLQKCVHFAPAPTCSNCPLKLEYPSCKIKCADEVGKILKKNPRKIAAMIAEPVQGNGGIQVPPKEYFLKVSRYLKRYGTLLIMDEAQTGFCRTGKKFAFEHYGIKPDILTVCKALGNGLPISAFVTTENIALKYTKPGASTFGGNLVPAEAARAALEFMSSNRLDRRASSVGSFLKKELQGMREKYPFIAEVRGIGMMIGTELRLPDGTPATAQTDAVLEYLKNHGLLMGKTGPGRNVLTLMPPLILTKTQAASMVRKIRSAFNELQDIFKG